MTYILQILAAASLTPAGAPYPETAKAAERDADTKAARVFIFAGQSNMPCENTEPSADDLRVCPY